MFITTIFISFILNVINIDIMIIVWLIWFSDFYQSVVIIFIDITFIINIIIAASAHISNEILNLFESCINSLSFYYLPLSNFKFYFHPFLLFSFFSIFSLPEGELHWPDVDDFSLPIFYLKVTRKFVTSCGP